MEFRVLGPLEVLDEGNPVALTAPRQRALLAVLLIHANEVVSTDRLLDLAWGEETPDVGALRYQVSKLRESLEPFRDSDGDELIVTRAPGYMLEIRPGQLDALDFEMLADEARKILRADPDRAIELLDEALGLWHGPAFSDFAYEEFSRFEILRLEERRLAAIEDRLDALLALGREREAIGELRTLVAEHPRRERLVGALMLALYRSGRQADALDVFRDLRHKLGEELGLQPSPRLVKLEGRILLQDESLLLTDTAPAAGFLRGYVLRGQIGEGAQGVVWRAAQPGVGREVAIKAIRPELANRPEFVRRFEAEAQLIAALEHPHIVSLFDFWRDPEGAYLVMPYLRGGDLTGVLQQGPLAPAAVMDLVAAIGNALGYAHTRGVVHRDVTPHNILFDEDAHPYLADFGMAGLLGADGPPVTSSPAYMSPEQAAGEKAIVQSDVFSLGVLVHTALTGRIPAAGEPLPPIADFRHDIAPAVDDIVSCATAHDCGRRYATVADLVDALGRSLGIGRDRSHLFAREERNPYKGLRAFMESDAGDFFGRDAFVSELVVTLARHRLVGVVGSSGCGKSSLVRAGAIPVLRRGGLPDSEHWLITDMYPGTQPFAELQAALLRVAVNVPDDLEDRLRRGHNDRSALLDVLLPAGSELLLVIDQFEELFTLTRDEQTRREFLAAIADLVGNPLHRVRIIVTLRADFFGRPLDYPEFGELLRRGLVSVASPGRDGLIEAIAGPARQVDVDVEAGLVERIADDVVDQPGGLPLLEYALTELFQRRQGTALTIAGYEQTGGVLGALGRRADALYTAYDDVGEHAAQQVFLRLVAVEEGSADTRRRIPLGELHGMGLDSDALQAVLDDFGSHRLLTFDRDLETRAPTVEVAHEALLSRWERLRTWIDDRRDDLVLHRRLTASLAEWHESGDQPAYLLSGGRLEHYETFAAESDLELTEEERGFLAQSRVESDRIAARRRRRRRTIMAGFAAVALIAVVLAVTALVSQRRAEDEATQARASELSAYAAQVLDEDPNLSLLLLLESTENSNPTDDVIAALHETMLKHRLIMRLTEPYAGGVLSPDGGMVISFGEETYAAIEVPTGRILWEQPRNSEEELGSESFTVDGDAVFGLQYINDEPTGVIRIDAATGDHTFYPIESEFPISDILTNGSGYLDADQPLIARSIEERPTAAVLRLDLDSGTAETIATYSTAAISRGFWTTDAAVTKVALGLSEKTAVLDLETGETRGFGPTSDYLADQILSPDGTLVLSLNSLGNYVWNIADDEVYGRIPGDLQGAAVFSLDGERIFMDNQVLTSDGQPLIVLPEVFDVPQPSADGHLVLAGDQILNVGATGEAGGVDLPMGGQYWPNVDFEGNTGAALHMTGSPEGRSSFGVVNIYGFVSAGDPTLGEVLLRIPTRAIGDPALSADGRLVALQQEVQPNWFGTIGLFETTSGEMVTELSGLCGADNNGGPGPDCRDYPETPFAGVAYHSLIAPDASFLAATLWIWDTSQDEAWALVVWDLASGEIVYRGDEGAWVGEPVLSPAGDRILFLEPVEEASARLVVLDTATWEHIGEIPWGEGEDGNPAMDVLRYGPDGSLLRWGAAGISQLEDVSWEIIRRGEEPDCFLRDLQFSPDGSTIAATCWDSGEVVVYDTANLRIESHITTDDPSLRGVKFVGDSEILVIGESGPGIILETDPEKLIQTAWDRVVGDFAEEECVEFEIERCMPQE